MTTQSEPTLVCPKCNETMRQLKVDDLIIDRCEKCFGIWLDKGEGLKLRGNKKLVDMVDVAPAGHAESHNKMTDVDCPRCSKTMATRHHPDQKHIQFEQCQECGGCYFDAGELHDLSRFTLSDLMSFLIKKK